MAGKGGYQRPSSPAPVSGPGSMSQRTDGGPSQPIRDMTGGDYGDATEMRDIQGSAPMAASGTPQTQGQQAASQPMVAPPGDLFRASERPDEPITEGSPFGEGSGPESLSLPRGGQEVVDADMVALRTHLPSLMRAAQGDAPEGFKRFVRHLRNLG